MSQEIGNQGFSSSPIIIAWKRVTTIGACDITGYSLRSPDRAKRNPGLPNIASLNPGYALYRAELHINRMQRMFTRAAASIAAMLVLFAPAAHVAAADIAVFTSAAPAEVEKALAAKYTEATGHRASFTTATQGCSREARPREHNRCRRAPRTGGRET
jgi:hypothetical protein